MFSFLFHSIFFLRQHAICTLNDFRETDLLLFQIGFPSDRKRNNTDEKHVKRSIDSDSRIIDIDIDSIKKHIHFVK